MASLLRPAYTLTIGGQRWTQQAIEIDVELAAAPGIDRLRVHFPAIVPLEAAPDDRVELRLDGGDGEEAVFSGTVASIRRALDTILVTAHGPLARLTRYRPATTFENVSAGTVIRSLAADAGVPVGEVEDGVKLAFYAADPARNAAEHALRVAEWSGALLASTGAGEVSAIVVNATQADVALRHGREITAFTLEEGRAPDRVTVAGESGADSDSSPRALRPIADVFAGNRPEGPSLGHVWAWEPALRTAAAAATAGAARQRLANAAQARGHIEAFLLPALRPGIVVEIQDLPGGLSSGPYWIDQARHRIRPSGATTSARLMKGGDSFDPLALLGSLGGALAAAF